MDKQKEIGPGKKWDSGKLRYDLLDYKSIDELARVLTYGANKYDANNWQKIEANRYQAALGRHFSSYMQGEMYDQESGIHHLSHVMANVMFLMYKEREKEYKKGT